MIFSIRMAMRYLLGRKLRTALTTLSIMFGVMILFGMNAILPGVMESFRQNTMAIANQVDVTITGRVNGTFSQEITQTIQHWPGVKAAMASLRQNVILILPGEVDLVSQKMGMTSNSTVLTVNGILPDELMQVRPQEIIEGRFLKSGETGVIVIPQKTLAQTELKLGDMLILPSAQGNASFQVIGVMADQPTAGGAEVFVALSDAQAMFNLKGQITTVEGMLESGANRAKIMADMQTTLGENYHVGEMEMSNEMLATMEMGQVALSFFGIVALLMGGFVIFNTFRTLVAERRREIGLLRSVGASRRTVMGLILTESFVQGIFGTVLGLLAGAAMAIGMVAALAPITEGMLRFKIGNPIFTLDNFLFSSLLGIGITVLGGLWPAYAATRVTPLEAMRPSLQTGESVVRRNLIPGLAIMAVSLVGLLSGNFALSALGMVIFVIGLIWVAPALVQPLASVFGRLIDLVFARESMLASGNMTRQPGRSAITASALMIGMAMFLSLAGLVTSLENAFGGYIETSLGADYLFMPQSIALAGGNVGAAPELAETIRQMPEVDAIASLRMARGRINGNDLNIIGIDPVPYSKVSGLIFSDGDPESAFAAMDGGRAMIVNGLYASAYQVRVGDSVEVDTPTGLHTYQIAGIGMDYLNAKMQTGYISQANLAEDFGVRSDLLLMVNGKSDADNATLFAKLDLLVKNYPAFTLYNAQAWKDSQMGMLSSVMGAMYVMLTFLAAPSLLALINTLAINVIERTREIGLV
ncbi:MAG TPA: ABC transporter permease, partial [Anaerolineaceae bacterium]|nr:ABC transporter permease [Anaerolineaceae bacterium]